MNQQIAVKGIFITGLLLVLTLLVPVLKNNNPVDMVTYNHDLGSFQHPKGWKTNQRALGGKEIPLHVELINQQSDVYGFIQIWQIKGGIAAMINPANTASTKIEHVKTSKLTLAGHKMHQLDYQLAGEQPRQVKELLYQQGPYIYRLMVTASEKEWTPQLEAEFLAMGQSLKFK